MDERRNLCVILDLQIGVTYKFILNKGFFFFSPGKVNGVCVGSTEIESHLQVTKIVVFTLLV